MAAPTSTSSTPPASSSRLPFRQRSRPWDSCCSETGAYLRERGTPLCQGVNVLLHTRRMWAGPSATSSQWNPFDEYLYSDTLVGFLALAIMTGAILALRRSSDQGAT